MEHLAVCSFVRLQAYAAGTEVGTLQPHGRTRWSLRVEKLVPGRILSESPELYSTLAHSGSMALRGRCLPRIMMDCSRLWPVTASGLCRTG
jgi:hypothetical protein